MTGVIRCFCPWRVPQILDAPVRLAAADEFYPGCSSGVSYPGDTNQWPNSLPPAPPPRFTHIDRLPTGAITITWQATPGRLYRVEAKDSLGDATWTALTVAAPATADTVSVIDPAGAQRQRFYRIAQAD